MVSFPKFPTGVATAPVKWVGCDANNIYHKQNRKTLAAVALLAAASFGYNRFLAARLPLSTLAKRAIVLGGSSLAVGYNNFSIYSNSSAAVRASQPLVLDDVPKTLEADSKKIKDLQAGAEKALEKVSGWNRWIEGLEKANLKQFTLENLAATMRNESQGVEAMVKWSLDKFHTPKEAASKQNYWSTNTNTLLKDAMSIAMNAYNLARAEILLDDIPTNTDADDIGTPTLRTTGQARTYVERLDAAGRERLEKALTGPFMVYSFARGLASQKPEGVEFNPGYAADWNSEENQNRFYNSKDNTQAKLLEQYNDYAEAAQFVSWVQAPQAADKTQPPIVKDEKGSGFNLAVFPAFLTTKESKIEKLTKPEEEELTESKEI